MTLSLFVSLCLSLFVSLSLFVFLSLFVSLFVYLYLSLSLSLFLFLILHLLKIYSRVVNFKGGGVPFFVFFVAFLNKLSKKLLMGILLCQLPRHISHPMRLPNYASPLHSLYCKVQFNDK